MDKEYAAVETLDMVEATLGLDGLKAVKPYLYSLPLDTIKKFNENPEFFCCTLNVITSVAQAMGEDSPNPVFSTQDLQKAVRRFGTDAELLQQKLPEAITYVATAQNLAKNQGRECVLNLNNITPAKYDLFRKVNDVLAPHYTRDDALDVMESVMTGNNNPALTILARAGANDPEVCKRLSESVKDSDPGLACDAKRMADAQSTGLRIVPGHKGELLVCGTNPGKMQEFLQEVGVYNHVKRLLVERYGDAEGRKAYDAGCRSTYFKHAAPQLAAAHPSKALLSKVAEKLWNTYADNQIRRGCEVIQTAVRRKDGSYATSAQVYDKPRICEVFR